VPSGDEIFFPKRDGRGSIPGRDKRFFSTLQRPDRLWGPPSLVSYGYRRLLPRGYSSRGVKRTTHLHQMPRSRMMELYLTPPYVFMAQCLIKHRDNSTFLFLRPTMKILERSLCWRLHICTSLNRKHPYNYTRR
jgi:hypothetical protein